MPTITPIDLFDCNATIGRRAVRNPESPYTIEGLARIMDHHKIKHALVSHAICESSGPFPGNELLLSEIEGFERFVPCWVLLPEHTGELGDMKALMKRMAEANVRAVKMYPVKHYFNLSEWCVGSLVSELERRRVPLLMDFDIVHYSDAQRRIQWDQIYELCKNHQDLPIILLRVGMNVNRNLFPLLGRFENIFMDISYYQANDGIETICEAFGAHHLLFGTGLPIFSSAAPISMLMYSGISHEEKRMIGGLNLRKLLDQVSME